MKVRKDQKSVESEVNFICSILLTICAAAACLSTPDALAARRNAKPPAAQGDFTDLFFSYETAHWLKADGWKNGSPFDNAWLADHIGFSDGLMDIRLDNQASLGEPYSSGNYQTIGFYGYGCYEASFKPVANSGVVSSFFTFAGPYDNGGNGLHNEIDIEFLGYDATFLQTNFWANDDSYAGGNEHLIELGFDASEAFHRYGFKWTSAGIEWFVDGAAVYQVIDSPANPTPKAGDSLQKIMMNVWPVDSTASGWAGTFAYPGSTLHGYYDWVRHIAGEDCSLAEPPSLPPPPDGDPAAMHVQAIALSLNARKNQVIARVAVVNGLGEAVTGVTVNGAWSGVISNGDTERLTDANGIATFYSGRSNNPGEVTFCVTGMIKSGMSYDAGDNAEDCVLISK